MTTAVIETTATLAAEKGKEFSFRATTQEVGAERRETPHSESSCTNATSAKFGHLKQQRRCLRQRAGWRCLGAARRRTPLRRRRLEPRPSSRRWLGSARGNLSADSVTPDFRCCIPTRRSSFE